jgi:hypothetical protein
LGPSLSWMKDEQYIRKSWSSPGHRTADGNGRAALKSVTRHVDSARNGCGAARSGFGWIPYGITNALAPFNIPTDPYAISRTR